MLASGPSPTAVSRIGPAIALVALGLTWGITIPLTKIAVSTGHAPLGVIFWQLALSCVVLLAVSAARRVYPPVSRRTLGYFLALALLGTLLPNSASLLALGQLPAGVMAIIIASVPMFSLTIALSIRAEGFEARRVLGVLLGAGAVCLLIGPGTSLPEPEKAVFVLVALLAPFFYGAEGNYIARYGPRTLDAVATLLGASLVGCLLAGPAALASGTFVDLTGPWTAAEWALLGAAMGHVVAYTGYIWLVRVAGAVFASQIAYLVTLSGVLLSKLILGETYSGWVWSSLVLMIAGLSLVRPRAARDSLRS